MTREEFLKKIELSDVEDESKRKAHQKRIRKESTKESKSLVMKTVWISKNSGTNIALRFMKSAVFPLLIEIK